MKYLKWCCRPGSNLQVRDTLHFFASICHYFGFTIGSKLAWWTCYSPHVAHGLATGLLSQFHGTFSTVLQAQWYSLIPQQFDLPPVLFIATSHAVTGEHRGWSPSYLASKVVPRGYSGSLELIKRPGTCYYQITCLNFCCQTLVKSAQRVWRIRNSDYLASTVVVEWFERLLPVPGSALRAVDLRLFES